MPAFTSKPLNSRPSPMANLIRRRPFLVFGLPFITIVTLSSFALEGFAKTRYDLHDQKVFTMTKEEEMGLKAGRKRVDIREEYYLITQRLTAEPGSDRSALDATLSAPSSPSSLSSPSSPSPAPPRRPKFSMAPKSQDELENVRVPRPAGMPEWGPALASKDDAPIKGHRKEDRWV